VPDWYLTSRTTLAESPPPHSNLKVTLKIFDYFFIWQSWNTLTSYVTSHFEIHGSPIYYTDRQPIHYALSLQLCIDTVDFRLVHAAGPFYDIVNSVLCVQFLFFVLPTAVFQLFFLVGSPFTALTLIEDDIYVPYTICLISDNLKKLACRLSQFHVTAHQFTFLHNISTCSMTTNPSVLVHAEISDGRRCISWLNLAQSCSE
jgi:hypothetical protein